LLSSSTRKRTPSSPRLQLGLELEQLIAQQRRLLEIECFSGSLHLGLEQPDQASRSAASAGRRGAGGTRLPRASAKRVTKRMSPTDFTIERGVMPCSTL
jgi:hypothetical protein